MTYDMPKLGICPMCASNRIRVGEVWKDRESGTDYDMYCECCDWEDYI